MNFDTLIEKYFGYNPVENFETEQAIISLAPNYQIRSKI
jgi:hypothetical protein